MYLWILLSICFIYIFRKLLLYKPTLWKDKNVRHFPPKNIFGSIYELTFGRKSMADWVQEMYNKSDGRYFGAYFFSAPSLLIRDLDLIKQITIKDFDVFVDRSADMSVETEPLFGRLLFSLQEEKWRDMRPMLSPAFTGNKMRSMFLLMTECAEEFPKYYDSIMKENEILTVEFKDVCSRFANDVIATCAFGIKTDSLRDENNELYTMGKQVSGFTGARGFIMLGQFVCPSLMKLLNLSIFSKKETNFFRHLVKSNIETREKEGIIRPDMIHLLMEAKKGKLKHEEDGKNEDGFATVQESEHGLKTRKTKFELSDDDIAAQAVQFFLAGFDSTSSLLSFMAYELTVNDDVQKKLQQEIDDVMLKNNGKVNYEILMKMKYLDMVVSETLRKWPPITSVDRKSSKPYTIRAVDPNETDLELDAKSIFWIPVYPIHRDPKYFPNPDRFDPERFSDENKDNIQPFSYLPFGMGPRNCIGSRFVLLETKAFFVYLLAKFELVVVEKTQIPLKLNKFALSMDAENGFWIGLKRRNNIQH